MKNLIITIAVLCTTYASIAQNCVRGISTNINDPINDDFSGTNLLNPWLNTSFDIAPLDLNGFGFAPLDMNFTAGWSVPDYVSGNLLMNSPFDDGVPGRVDLNQAPFEQRDFHWENGWELLWVNTGFFPNGDMLKPAQSRLFLCPMLYYLLCIS
jgi:hypothetical protein